MKNELNNTFSNFCELKINCHPFISGKHNRRYNATFTRLRNISASDQRQSANHSPEKETPTTTQLKSRCRKILQDKRFHYQRKLGTAVKVAAGLEVDMKLLTDTSLPDREELTSGNNSRLSRSVAKYRQRISSEYFNSKVDEYFIRHEPPIKRNSRSKSVKKRATNETEGEQKPMEILTITKINTEDSIQRYYDRLLEICLEKERQIDRKIVNCKMMPRKADEKRPLSRNNRVKTSQTQQQQLMLRSSNTFSRKEESEDQLDQEKVQFLSSECASPQINMCRAASPEFRGGIFAKAYSIVHMIDGRYDVIFQHNHQAKLEIASLTKIMTCLLVLLIAERFRINLSVVETCINQKSSKLQGTSAKLQYGDTIKIFDLLHGLMLPSGNDAALALAEWGGKMIRSSCSRVQRQDRSSPRLVRKQMPVTQPSRTNVGLFIYHMNGAAKQLGMVRTRFANSHGLMNKRNFSCTADLVRLCIYCMGREDFRSIVRVRSYSCQVVNKKYATQRTQCWLNTNRLLRNDAFMGIKTGITPSAGPCLASCYAVSPNEWVFVVLLNTLTVAHRFEQSKKLLAVTLKHLYTKSGSKPYVQLLQQLCQQTPREEQPAEDSNNFEPSDDSQYAYEDESFA